MGSVGDCYDNAMAESLFATLETELIDLQPRRRFRSSVEVSREIFLLLGRFLQSAPITFSVELSVTSSV